MSEEAHDEPQELTPFRIVNRGEDTVDSNNNVQFADFSPRVLPSEIPDEVVEVPKDESAPEPAPSSVSTETSEPVKSETPVPTPVVEDDGMPSPSESGKRTSSSPKKNG